MQPERSLPAHEAENAAEPVSSSGNAAMRERLLKQVLGETLARRSNDPGSLVEALRPWRLSLGNVDLDLEICIAMVTEILRHRLGAESNAAIKELYAQQMYEDVASALWANPESRVRIRTLWDSLGRQES